MNVFSYLLIHNIFCIIYLQWIHQSRIAHAQCANPPESHCARNAQIRTSGWVALRAQCALCLCPQEAFPFSAHPMFNNIELNVHGYFGTIDFVLFYLFKKSGSIYSHLLLCVNWKLDIILITLSSVNQLLPFYIYNLHSFLKLIIKICFKDDFPYQFAILICSQDKELRTMEIGVHLKDVSLSIFSPEYFFLSPYLTSLYVVI